MEFLQISQGHSISSDIFPLETDIPPPISPILTNYTTCCCESPLFLLNIIIFPFVVYDYIHNHLYMTFLFNMVKNILIDHVCSEVLCLTTVLLDLILPHIHRLIVVFSPIWMSIFSNTSLIYCSIFNSSLIAMPDSQSHTNIVVLFISIVNHFIYVLQIFILKHTSLFTYELLIFHT